MDMTTPVNLDNPLLGPEHLAQIRFGLAQLDKLQPHINQAKAAGLDMTQQQANVDATRAKLLAIKNTYFPNT
jgi:hypothetical protein